MSIYEKPTKTLMLDFAKEKLVPGAVFDKKLAVDWFKGHYPDIRPTTVQMHVEGMATNSTLRKHHSNIRQGSGHDLFFKIGPGRFRLWEGGTDPAPVYQSQLQQPLAIDRDSDEFDEEALAENSPEFAYERDLQNYLAKNLQTLGADLRVYESEGLTGIEFPAGGRLIDILAVEKSGDFVVIELKVSRGYDRVVGQLMRYMAWVKANLAGEKRVKGIIVASNITVDLKLAASLLPGVRLFEYELSFKLKGVT